MNQREPESLGPTPSTIPYADVPARLGIVYETWPGGLRITIPGWPGGPAAALFMTALLVSPLLLLVVRRLLLADFAIVVVGLVIEAVAALVLHRRTSRWFRPKVIEVSDRGLTLVNVRLLHAESEREFGYVFRPRVAVYEVKYVSHSGNLVIKASGHPMIECRPVRGAESLKWVAALLREALELK